MGSHVMVDDDETEREDECCGHQGCVLHEGGVVLLRGWLSPQSQVEFYEAVNRIYEERGPRQHGDIVSLQMRPVHHGRYLLTFESSAEAIPDEFQCWGSSAIGAASFLCEAVPSEFHAVRMNSVL